MDWIIFKTNVKGTSQSEIAFNKLSKKNQDVLTKWLFEKSILSKSEKRAGNRKRAIVKLLTFIKKDYNTMAYEDYVNVASAISKSNQTTEQKNGEREFIKRFLRENFEDWDKKFKGLKLLKHEVKGDDEKLTAEDLFTELELKRMIESTTNMQDKALIITFYESASRPEELLKTRYSDIDFKRGLIYLFSGKTKRKRAIPLEQSLNHLRRLKEERNARDEELIFPSINNDIMSSAGLGYKLKQIGDKAGLKKKIYAYKFRHTRLSHLITKLSPKVYEEVAGHSLQMGMKTYAHLSKDKIIQEMNEKVFGIKELTKEERDEIQKLREENQRIRIDVKKEISELKQNIISEIKDSLKKKGLDKKFILMKDEKEV